MGVLIGSEWRGEKWGGWQLDLKVWSQVQEARAA